MSRGKQLGLTAHYIPIGILVCVWKQPNMPQIVVGHVEAICDRLRQA